MKIIDLEAHFYTRPYIEYLGKRKVVPREVVQDDIIKLWYDDKLWAPRSSQLQERLLDLGEGRIKEMDAAGIDMQVISLTNPNVQLFEPEEGSRWAKIVASKGNSDPFSSLLQSYLSPVGRIASLCCVGCSVSRESLFVLLHQA